MQVKDFVQLYRALYGTPYAVAFLNAEICAEHDEIYIHFDKPVSFAESTLSYLAEEYGLHVHQTEDVETDVVSFIIYI